MSGHNAPRRNRLSERIFLRFFNAVALLWAHDYLVHLRTPQKRTCVPYRTRIPSSSRHAFDILLRRALLQQAKHKRRARARRVGVLLSYSDLYYFYFIVIKSIYRYFRCARALEQPKEFMLMATRADLKRIYCLRIYTRQKTGRPAEKQNVSVTFDFYCVAERKKLSNFRARAHGPN